MCKAFFYWNMVCIVIHLFSRYSPRKLAKATLLWLLLAKAKTQVAKGSRKIIAKDHVILTKSKRVFYTAHLELESKVFVPQQSQIRFSKTHQTANCHQINFWESIIEPPCPPHHVYSNTLAGRRRAVNEHPSLWVMTPSFNLRPVDILLYAKLCLGLGGDSWVFSPVIRDPICARGFWRTAAQSH